MKCATADPKHIPTIRKLGGRLTRTIRWKLDSMHGPSPDPIGDSAKQYANAVRIFINTMHIKSVVELECGDFRFGRVIARSGVHYTGVDALETVIERNRHLYEGRKVRFIARDVIEDELPDGDLCLAGGLFQHRTNAEIRLLLLKLRKYKYLIFSDHQPPFGTFVPNLDKPDGKGTRLDCNSALDFQKPPFNIRYVETFIILTHDNPDYNPNERLCSFLIRSECQDAKYDPVYLD